MYVLALGAILISAIVVVLERQTGRATGGVTGLVTLSFTCYGLATGLFWILLPSPTALAPGGLVEAFGEQPGPYLGHAVGALASAVLATVAMALGDLVQRSGSTQSALARALVIATGATAVLGLLQLSSGSPAGALAVGVVVLNLVIAGTFAIGAVAMARRSPSAVQVAQGGVHPSGAPAERGGGAQ